MHRYPFTSSFPKLFTESTAKKLRLTSFHLGVGCGMRTCSDMIDIQQHVESRAQLRHEYMQISLRARREEAGLVWIRKEDCLHTHTVCTVRRALCNSTPYLLAYIGQYDLNLGIDLLLTRFSRFHSTFKTIKHKGLLLIVTVLTVTHLPTQIIKSHAQR